jgi:hypothetical protein
MWMSYYLPLTPGFFSILVGFFVIVLILRSVRYAYESLGVSSDTAIFLLFATLIGSIFNIPITELPPERVMSIPYDIRFFQTLDRFVQQEPWLTRDKAMIDQLRSIGIEKGKPFAPDTKTEGILNDAVLEAHALLERGYQNAFPPYFTGRRWALPADPQYIKAAQSGYAEADTYPVDARGLVFSFAFFTPKGGTGSFYLMDIRDKDGEAFDGGKTYRLTVPANVPVRQYWSATVYDRATHALIRDQKTVSRSSQSSGLQRNADGSVDVYFGPKAPVGKEPNWVPTSPSGKFEVLFRFYGPEKPLFDKTWVLPDIERIAAQ